MKMQALVALREHGYGGKRYRPGDVFLATPRDARILIALGRAQADHAPYTLPEVVVDRIDAQAMDVVLEGVGMAAQAPAQSLAVESAAGRPQRSQRRYTRRKGA